MTDDSSQFLSEHPVWRGDWRRRLYELLVERGFTHLLAYAETKPTYTLEQMAEDLGSNDVAPIALQWALAEEARVEGDLEPCARDLLVRCLHESPSGWPASHDWEGQEITRHALSEWQECLRDQRYDAALENMTEALLDDNDISTGWAPSNSCDSRIVSLFERYWPYSSN